MGDEVEYFSQYNSNPLVKKLENFLELKKFQTPPRSKYTNIINQVKKGGHYFIPFGNEIISMSNISFDLDEEEDPDSQSLYPASMPTRKQTYLEEHISEMCCTKSDNYKYPIEEFFALLEECRLQGIFLGYCEKQYFVVPMKRKSLKPVPSDVFSTEELVGMSGIDIVQEPKNIYDTSELCSIDKVDELLSEDVKEEPIEDFDKIADSLIDDIVIDNSCIELDFDIYQKENTRLLQDVHFYTLVYQISAILGEQLDFNTMEYPSGVMDKNGGNTTVKFHVVILNKPNVVETTHKKYGKCWKDSFHIRLFVKVNKGYKKFLIQTINERSLLSILQDIHLLNPYNEILDSNSPQFPAMFLGSMKVTGKIPQQFFKLYSVEFKNWPNPAPLLIVLKDFDPLITDEKPQKIPDPLDRRRRIMKSPIPKYRYNLCYELSLNYEATNGFIRKRDISPKANILSQIQAFTERSENNIISIDELSETQEYVNNLTVRDYEAKYIQKILDILKPERASDYETWKSIIVMLAHENPDYKPLAIYFSQRCPISWAKNGASQLDGIWEWACNHPPSSNSGEDDGPKYRKINTLYSWAKEDNPEKYREIQEFNAFMKTQKMAFEFSGKLHETHFAEILRIMYGHMFLVDENEFSTTKGRDRRWYEFVFPEDQKYDSGYAYKWRLERYPDTLDRFISKKLPLFVKKVREFIKDKNESNAVDEGAQKYYATVGKNLEDSESSLGRNAMIRNIISRCEIEFRERGFLDNLDKDPCVIGVGNGVLRLFPKTELIQRYHEIPVSRSTRVPYMMEKIDINDPNYSINHSNPYIRHLITEIQRLFAGQRDAFIYTMCYLASSLDSKKKNPLFFLWLGEGSNGKSFLLELHIKTLHEVVRGGYAAKINSAFFTKESKSHGGPESEKMMLKYARFSYCSESQEGDILQMGKIKEFTSETLTGNEKHQTQDMFEANCHFVFCTNHDPRITGRDYGTWRRILVYYFKMKFVDNPDLDNPYEYMCDVKLVNEVPYNMKYKQAYLSIIVYFYEMYRDIYGSNLSKIPKMTIDKETQKYKDEQDTIERYISQQVIKIGECYTDGEKVSDINLSDLAAKYAEWHKRKIGDLTVPIKDITKAFPQTRLKKFIVKRFNDDYLTQHKVLNIGEEFTMDPSTTEEPELIPVSKSTSGFKSQTERTAIKATVIFNKDDLFDTREDNIIPDTIDYIGDMPSVNEKIEDEEMIDDLDD
jgi:phage/plasmid-associated DNA primase